MINFIPDILGHNVSIFNFFLLVSHSHLSGIIWMNKFIVISQLTTGFDREKRISKSNWTLSMPIKYEQRAVQKLLYVFEGNQSVANSMLASNLLSSYSNDLVNVSESKRNEKWEKGKETKSCSS